MHVTITMHLAVNFDDGKLRQLCGEPLCPPPSRARPEALEARAAATARLEAPDAVAYNTLIKGYVHARRPQRCFALYAEMKSAGVAPTETTVGRAGWLSRLAFVAFQS